MRGRLTEYIPRPFQFGIGENRPILPIANELRSLSRKDAVVIQEAKEKITTITEQYPSVIPTTQQLDMVKPYSIKDLYALPSRSLIYTSPHNMRHFAAMDVLVTFIGSYANAQLAKRGEKPLDIEALRLSAWTHDSFRSRFDILGTVVNYQLHGIRAGENLEAILRRGKLPIPQTQTLERAREIDTYHDVDKRPLGDRSRELELFTAIDKLEMVRLFHPTQLRFRIPVIAQGIRYIAKRRLQSYEGQRGELMSITKEFLPVVDGLYRLTMQKINIKRRTGAKWEDIDQYEAVIMAGQELGMIQR